MSTLSLIAAGIVLLAVAGLAFDLPDHWFFALLALASLLCGADTAYHGLRAWAVAFLFLGLALTGAAAHAALTAGRKQGERL